MVTEDLDSLAFFTSESALSAITGSTHGIRFKIRPPIRAKIIAVSKLMPDCWTDFCKETCSSISKKPDSVEIIPFTFPLKLSNAANDNVESEKFCLAEKSVTWSS